MSNREKLMHKREKIEKLRKKRLKKRFKREGKIGHRFV